MADDAQLPCNGNGICMSCGATPSDEAKIPCKTCDTPWHVICLAVRPQTLASALDWDCPDCSLLSVDFQTRSAAKSVLDGAGDGFGDLVASIRAIEADESLTEQEKARKRQAIVSGKSQQLDLGEENAKRKGKMVADDDALDSSLSCSFCLHLLERPVTTPCGHNFCLKCFQKWIGQGKRTCAKCRNSVPPKMASHPRINSTLVVAIRMAKMSKAVGLGEQTRVYPFVDNQDRPNKAYTTERAKKNGNANAASGKIFVTVSPDHFGPILAENDPERNQGVLVGECWEDRMECRQWGVHRTHVAGIAGQSEFGAQSVALSGGYEDDEDHGEWFLYTGSGGRDLSGNRRTNKSHSFDQRFVKMNEALRVSCKNGYPVRVVRSHKEKRSSYAPEKGVRYDGIYRIEKCWRKVGIQGYKVCRYLFVRCDNEPAPWTSDEHGDRPRPLPDIPELEQATDVTERKRSPSWDFDDDTHLWKWKKTPPVSRKLMNTGNPVRKRKRTAREKLPKDFYCSLCQKVMTLPVTTPCAHNFCKACVQDAFVGKTLVRERLCFSGQALRSQKNVMKCPSCPADISEFLENPQVNRDLMDLIQSLQYNTQENEDSVEESADDGTDSSGNSENINPLNSSSKMDDEKKPETHTEDKSDGGNMGIQGSLNGQKTGGPGPGPGHGRGRGRPAKNGGRGRGRPPKTSAQERPSESTDSGNTGKEKVEEAAAMEANDSLSSPMRRR